jgi:hypothetical protein
MHDTVSIQVGVSASTAGLAPYLKALTFAGGLLAVWAGLCAI